MEPRDEPTADGRPEALLAATLLLMSAYAREGGSPRLAGAVLQHLGRRDAAAFSARRVPSRAPPAGTRPATGAAGP